VVLVGGIYVLADFRVGAPLVETGPVTDIEALSTTLGDSFLTAFHFGNDTKEWTFHDPHMQEESTLEFLIPGDVVKGGGIVDHFGGRKVYHLA